MKVVIRAYGTDTLNKVSAPYNKENFYCIEFGGSGGAIAAAGGGATKFPTPM